MAQLCRAWGAAIRCIWISESGFVCIARRGKERKKKKRDGSRRNGGFPWDKHRLMWVYMVMARAIEAYR